jgi:hypothetical protein
VTRQRGRDWWPKRARRSRFKPRPPRYHRPTDRVDAVRAYNAQDTRGADADRNCVAAPNDDRSSWWRLPVVYGAKPAGTRLLYADEANPSRTPPGHRREEARGSRPRSSWFERARAFTHRERAPLNSRDPRRKVSIAGEPFCLKTPHFSGGCQQSVKSIISEHFFDRK